MAPLGSVAGRKLAPLTAELGASTGTWGSGGVAVIVNVTGIIVVGPKIVLVQNREGVITMPPL